MKNLFHIIIIIGLGGCNSNGANLTVLDSDDYESKVDRIKIIKKEIKSFLDFHDAEFELFNVNGFHNQRTLTIGESSWDYKFAIRVDTANISKWTNGMQEIKLNGYNDNWTKEITTKRKQNWQTSSEPQYFIRQGEKVTMLVYKNEGIIFKRSINL